MISFPGAYLISDGYVPLAFQWMKNTLLFTYSTNILVSLNHAIFNSMQWTKLNTEQFFFHLYAAAFY